MTWAKSSAGGQSLTGRKKELFKTGKGGYVAPAPIENMINECPLVELSLVWRGQQSAYAMVVLAEAGASCWLTRPSASAEFEAELAAVLKRVNASVRPRAAAA